MAQQDGQRAQPAGGSPVRYVTDDHEIMGMETLASPASEEATPRVVGEPRDGGAREHTIPARDERPQSAPVRKPAPAPAAGVPLAESEKEAAADGAPEPLASEEPPPAEGEAQQPPG